MTKKHEELNREELRSAPLWIASRLLLRPAADEFLAAWKKVKETSAEDDIHDLRVSSRRLREALALFSPLHKQRETRRLAGKVRKVTRLLGEIRNTDEAYRFFSELGVKAPYQAEIEALLAKLRRARAKAHRGLKKQFRSMEAPPRKGALHALAKGQNIFDDSADYFMKIGRFAADAVMQRAEPVRELLPRALREHDGTAQHELRIAVKKLRYRLEILAPLLKKEYDLLHKGLKDHQDVLGRLHDVEVFMAMVGGSAVEGSGKRELLRVMRERKKALFAGFVLLEKEFPLQSAGERARDAL